ncbi:hypothetical protein RintRC_6479 [Richelia intracellularis]|nr:hypothetical protein RintRC_6479 [Richelia intracellularis]
MPGVAESRNDFTKFSTISQWFQTLIHSALMQRQFSLNKFRRNYVKVLPVLA